MLMFQLASFNIRLLILNVSNERMTKLRGLSQMLCGAAFATGHLRKYSE